MNNHRPIISIIVPVYNAENFLSRCLSSLLNQSYNALEIICVNDGSTDGSAQILQQYASQHHQIKVLHQQNAGTGTTRNNGLQAATGDYVMFCDADDAFHPTMCEDMLRTLEDQQVDLVMCDCRIVKTDNIHRAYMQDENNNYFRLSIFGKTHLNDRERFQINSVLWNKIFKKSVIDQYNITFPLSLLNHEDASFVWQYLAVSHTFYGLNKVLYDYYLQQNSLMTALYANPEGRQKFDIVYSISHFIDFLNQHNIGNQHKDLYELVMNVKLGLLLQALSPSSRLEALQLIHDLLLPKIDQRIIQKNPYLNLIQQHNFVPFMHLSSDAAPETQTPENKSTLLTDFAEHFSAAINEQTHQIDKTHEVLMNFCVNMATQLTKNEVQTSLPSDELRYKNLKEIAHLQTYFSRFSKQDPRIIALLKQLDSNSYQTVIHILQQIEQLNMAVSQSVGDGIRLYSESEKLAIKEFQRMFEPYILHVKHDYHQYKNSILPVNKFSSLAFYFNYGLSVLSHADKIKGKSIIDIGSQAGDSAVIFQQLNPQSVYLFEDDPVQIGLIKQTIALNNISNTKVISPDDVKATDDTVDAYVKAAKIDHIGLFKINAQTDIVPILQSAVGTISKHKPTLLVHIDHNWSNFLEVKPYIESLNLGYQIKIYKPVNGAIIQGTLLIAEQPDV